VIDSSLQNGVSVRRSCSILMIQYRRIARWQQRIRRGRGLQDRGPGPTEPLHKLLPEETSKMWRWPRTSSTPICPIASWP
jgi:hypothetical protein